MKKLILFLLLFMLSACEVSEPTMEEQASPDDVVQKFDVIYELTHTGLTQRLTYEVGKPITFVVPVREGYTFAGWYIDEALTIAFIAPNTMPSNDITLYPKWEVEVDELIDDDPVDEPTQVVEPVIPPVAEDAFVVLRSEDAYDDQLIGVFGEQIEFVSTFDIDQLSPAKTIVIFYDELLLETIPPLAFGQTQLRPLEVVVRLHKDKTFILVHPGVKSHIPTIAAQVNELDLATVQTEYLHDQTVLDLLYPEMVEYGRIGILTSLAQPGEQVPFLPYGTHKVFTSSRDFFAADLDTRVLFYTQEDDLGYPPSRFGRSLENGDVVGFTDAQGVKTILIKERFRERMEWYFLNYEALGLEGTYHVQDITNLFDYNGSLYRGPKWNVPRRTFTPVTAKNDSPLTELSTVVSAIDVCQIKQTNRPTGRFVYTNEIFGFPHNSNVPVLGEVNIAIIAIEFPDVPGEAEYLPIYLDQVDTIIQWSEFVSGGAMRYNVQFPERWIMAPREAKYYTRLGGTQMALDRPDAIAGQPFMDSVQQLITASDPYVDWSIIDFVQFVFPIESAKYAVDFQGPAYEVYSERAGRFDTWAWGAAYEKFRPDNPDPAFRTLWDWVVHEVLHPQGLPGHAPLNGSSYSIMMNQHGETKALLAWESFLLGYFDERHIACIEPETIDEEITIQLESLDETGGAPGIKSVMLKVSESEIVVIEYRTEGPFSILSPEFRGFTAYMIDVDGQYVRCDWCDPLLMESLNYAKYIRNPEEDLVCDRGNMSGAPVCGYPSIVQYPGFHLEAYGIKFEFFDDGILTMKPLY